MRYAITVMVKKAAKKGLQRNQLAMFSVIFAVAVISYFILSAFAADNSSAVEAELAVKTGDISTLQDEGASNFQYIQFNETASTSGGNDSSGDPPLGSCNYPTGESVAGSNPTVRTTPLNPSSGQTYENMIIRASDHGITNSGGNNTFRNIAVMQQSADNIKMSSNSTYENMFLDMALEGGHLDAMQLQGHTNVTIRNVTVRMNGNSGQITSGIFMDTKLGGQEAGASEVTFTVDCVKIINATKWGMIFGTNKYATKIRGRITNFTSDGEGIQMINNAGGDCVVEMDAQSRQHLSGGGCTIIDI